MHRAIVTATATAAIVATGLTAPAVQAQVFDGDPYNLQNRLFSCGSLQATDCIEAVEYRLIGDPTWTPATFTQPLNPADLPADLSDYDSSLFSPYNLEYWEIPGASDEAGFDDVQVLAFFAVEGGNTVVRVSMEPRAAGVPRTGIMMCDANNDWDPGAGLQCYRSAYLDLNFEYRFTLRLSGLNPAYAVTHLDNLDFARNDLGGGEVLFSVGGNPTTWQWVGDYGAAWNTARDDATREFFTTIYSLDAVFGATTCPGNHALILNTNGNGGGGSYDDVDQQIFAQFQGRTYDGDGTTPWPVLAELYLVGTLADCAFTIDVDDTTNVLSQVFSPSQPGATTDADYLPALNAMRVRTENVEFPIDFSALSRITAGRPQNVSLNAGDARIEVSWDPPAYTGQAAITDYRAVASPGGRDCTSGGGTSCIITGLDNGTDYTVNVVAINSAGEGLSSPDAGPATPQAPTPNPGTGPIPPIPAVPDRPGQALAVVDDSSVRLSWAPARAHPWWPVTSYTATLAPSGRSCQSATTSCTITGLDDSVVYTATVVAVNSVGTSAPSVPSDPFTRPAPTPQPQPVTLTITGTREGRHVRIQGTTSGLEAGERVRALISFDRGRTQSPGLRHVEVSADGTFAWSRKSARAIHVAFTAREVTSNAVVLPAHRGRAATAARTPAG